MQVRTAQVCFDGCAVSSSNVSHLGTWSCPSTLAPRYVSTAEGGNAVSRGSDSGARGAAVWVQQAAVRALKKERGAGDLGKLEDYEAAAEGLSTAASSFMHLRRLPYARSRVEAKKLDAHIDFCQNTLRKATVRAAAMCTPCICFSSRLLQMDAANQAGRGAAAVTTTHSVLIVCRLCHTEPLMSRF
jgi:hypothetical protein